MMMSPRRSFAMRAVALLGSALLALAPLDAAFAFSRVKDLVKFMAAKF